ncbi:MAG: AraC family transcriptional regulator ligand-binding domain-containing protein [Maritimibacter sp.]
MPRKDPISLTTVSAGFIQDWLDALQSRCTPDAMTSLLERSGLQTGLMIPSQRVTLTEIAQLYQLAVPETGDEMMGLWSRPIRPRALQHLVTVQREASSLVSALFRFSTFWNLLLDDFHLDLRSSPEEVELALVPYSNEDQPQRFGHMLMLKLAHGLLSWLSGSETNVKEVRFAFARPDFAADYAVVFPCPVEFDAPQTSILFDPRQFNRPITRSAAEASVTTFQDIKDALRRDIAIRALQQGTNSIEQIAFDAGFSAPANFHRAFRKWTDRTPGSYRS